MQTLGFCRFCKSTADASPKAEALDCKDTKDAKDAEGAIHEVHEASATLESTVARCQNASPSIPGFLSDGFLCELLVLKS